MPGRDVTREVFEGISSGGEVLFYVLTAVATLVFFVGIGVRLRKYVRGRAKDVIGSPLGFAGRVAGSLVDTAANRTVAKRDPYAGVFHAAIMWGFIVLFIGTAILTVESDIIRPLAPQFSFYWGASGRMMSDSRVRIAVPMNRTMKPHMIAAWKTPAYGSRFATVRLAAVSMRLRKARPTNPSGAPITSWARPRTYFRSRTPIPTKKMTVATAVRT